MHWWIACSAPRSPISRHTSIPRTDLSPTRRARVRRAASPWWDSPCPVIRLRVENGWMARDAAASLTLKTLRFFRDSLQSEQAGRYRLQGLLLSLPGHEDRATRVAMRTLPDRHDIAARRHADRSVLFRRRRGRKRKFATRPTRSIAASIGAGRRTGLKPSRKDGSRNAVFSTMAGKAITKRPSSTFWASDRRRIHCREKLRRLDPDLSMGKPAGQRRAVFRPPVHPSVFPRLDRLSRHPRRFHAPIAGAIISRTQRRAVAVHREYGARNPNNYEGYGREFWGITAGDGPGYRDMRVDGHDRRFFGYMSRGAPYGPDDGTIAPWAMLATLPFDTRRSVVRHAISAHGVSAGVQGQPVPSGFNPTLPGDDGEGWLSDGWYGLDQGLLVMMIENAKSGLIWKLLRDCPYVVAGLKNAGFAGGWLSP